MDDSFHRAEDLTLIHTSYLPTLLFNNEATGGQNMRIFTMMNWWLREATCGPLSKTS